MKIDAKKVEQRMLQFEQTCRDAGIKLTHQRIEIFREVAQSGDHPDAESVYNEVRKRIPTISLDTVYRTLWMLSELGLIKRLGIAHESTRFDANLERHHHFVCVQCGLTRDFYNNTLDKLNIRNSVQDIGQVETTHVEVRGVCHECSKKNRNNQ